MLIDDPTHASADHARGFRATVKRNAKSLRPTRQNIRNSKKVQNLVSKLRVTSPPPRRLGRLID
jgi:hypothetical protein